MTRFDSALDVAAAIRAKEVSPLEVLDHYLARVDELDPQLNAFSLRDDERARAEAKAAADRLAGTSVDELPPFLGVPIPIKDLNAVAGWPTSYGSMAVPDTPEERDDPVVERFREAGFVLMGKTTTPEFGTISMTESERHGRTRNPWNTVHTPGGSSGGAGAAVAAGMAPIAHASDGGGSIRIPASCNGLVGLKPSRNRIPNRAQKMVAASTSGVVTRTVADSAVALDVMSVLDRGAWNVAPPPERPYREEVGAAPGRLRIRISESNALGIPIDAACSAAVRRAADLLADLGHEVIDEPPAWPDPSQFLSGFLTIWSTIAAGIPGLDPEKMEPHNKANWDAAQATSSIAFTEAELLLQELSRELIAQFDPEAGGVDVLVTPTMAVEPPKVGSIWEGMDEEPGAPLVNATPMAAYTAMFNVTGQPAISLPLHVSDSGLPVGVQFAAGPWQEATLIRLASQLENAAPWADRWPNITA
ncbi:MAG TPA: amidase [Microthrixaceae bacterium]|mgnify:FL=1|nr:amidase [Microthrixaceae bacterium]